MTIKNSGHLMKIILFAYYAILVCGLVTYGQSGKTNQCKVTALDVTKFDPDDIEIPEKKGILLSQFDTEISNEMGITRILRLPKTRLFVIADVEYDKSTLASDKGRQSIFLSLSVSTRRDEDPFKSLAYASAELPLSHFDVARVSTIAKSDQRTFVLFMECRENIRYPAVWFSPINDPNKPEWEILPQEAKAGEVILSKRNELGILSNFAATPFELYGKRYASVEGFWQMMLYPDGPDDERADAEART